MNKKWKVLISAPYVQEDIERLRPILESKGFDMTLPKVNERLSEDELLEIIEPFEGVIAGDDKFTEKVFAKAKNLIAVSKWGIGIDSFDKAGAEKHGKIIRNNPGAFKNQVSDSILAYFLAFARQVSWMDKDIKDDRWQKRPLVSLNESTVGVIGIGNTGSETIKRLYGFGATILGNDIIEIDKKFIDKYSVKMVSKEELLKKSDFITLNCDLNDTSFHILSIDEFRMMKNSAVIANCARGPLIDEPALCDALKNGEIAGAGLDVFEEEPLPTDSPLRGFDNVMLAPHNSNGATGERERIHIATFNHLLEELEKSL